MDDDIGLYVDNNMFKLAMIKCGFKFRFYDTADAKRINELNCNLLFNVSSKSPVFKRLFPDKFILVHENCKRVTEGNGRNFRYE